MNLKLKVNGRENKPREFSMKFVELFFNRILTFIFGSSSIPHQEEESMREILRIKAGYKNIIQKMFI